MTWRRGIPAVATIVVSAVVLVVALTRESAEDETLSGTPAAQLSQLPDVPSPASPPEPSDTKAGEPEGRQRPNTGALGEELPEDADEDSELLPDDVPTSFDRDLVAELKLALAEVRLEAERKAESLLPDPTVETPTPDVPAPAVEFTLSSFNVLGSSHTSTAGSNRPAMPPGVVRIRWAAQLLARHGVSVVGFQEFQLDQQRSFRRYTNGRYDFYPGFSKGGRGSNNTIAWRKDTWEFVRGSTIPIPYFRGSRWPMPVVLLQHKKTGVSAFFSNFHNPASTARHPNNHRWKAMAAAMEVALVRRLMAGSDHPVFLTGDLNERESVFCLMTGRGGLVAANGGSNQGRCRPPGNVGIDWIFGSPDVDFSNYFAQSAGLVNRVTDHPMVVANARLRGS